MMNNTKTRSKESRKAKPLWLKWIFCAIPAAVAALLYLLLPHFPNFTEYAITRSGSLDFRWNGSCPQFLSPWLKRSCSSAYRQF